MKNLIFVAICLLGASLLKAQNSSAVFFTNNGEKMYVILNGVRYNETAQTNVRIDGLQAIKYKVRIIFEGDSSGFAEDDIQLKHFYETTFSVETADKTAAGKKMDTWGKNISRDLNIPNSDKEKPTHKIKRQSEVRTGNNSADAFSTAPAEERTSNASSNTSTEVRSETPARQQANVQTTTTVNGQPATGTVSANVSVPGVSMNVSVNDNMTYSETYSTTTTTSGGGTQYGTQDHYVMPGYNGRIGCPWPMNDGDFAGAKSSISSKTWDESRLTMAKQVIGSNCLTSAQVRDPMNVFEWEETKLDFAKYAYGYTFDLNNYYKVNDAFEWESSITELNSYIQGR